MLMKRVFILLFFLCCLITSRAQQHATEGNKIRISLLTCAPSDDVYTAFGHTAIRIVDSTLGSDWVYNYGLFNFEDEYFYLKFILGNLNYSLGIQQYSDFLAEYQYFSRTVIEQEIVLPADKKKHIQGFLNHNALPENRNYRYDFIDNNCATKARDILLKEIANYTIVQPFVPSNTTARDLLHYYLDNGNQKAWLKLGIDILLGSGVDTVMRQEAAMFLPHFLMLAVNNIRTDNSTALGKVPLSLFQAKEKASSNYYEPLIVMTLIALFCFCFYVLFSSKSQWQELLDKLLFFVTGILGCLLLFMWLCTSHKSCANNFNVLWALPTNLLIVTMRQKYERWAKIYCLFAAILSALLLVTWFVLPQKMNVALMPFIFLLMFRYFTLFRAFLKKEKYVQANTI